MPRKRSRTPDEILAGLKARTQAKREADHEAALTGLVDGFLTNEEGRFPDWKTGDEEADAKRARAVAVLITTTIREVVTEPEYRDEDRGELCRAMEAMALAELRKP